MSSHVVAQARMRSSSAGAGVSMLRHHAQALFGSKRILPALILPPDVTDDCTDIVLPRCSNDLELPSLSEVGSDEDADVVWAFDDQGLSYESCVEGGVRPCAWAWSCLSGLTYEARHQLLEIRSKIAGPDGKIVLFELIKESRWLEARRGQRSWTLLGQHISREAFRNATGVSKTSSW